VVESAAEVGGCPSLGVCRVPRQYPFNGVYTDLVPNDERKSRPFWELSAREVGTQELFRSEFTSPPILMMQLMSDPMSDALASPSSPPHHRPAHVFPM
jgi:hypothetical protein